MDALSEILKALRLTSGMFLDVEFTAPWCVDSAPSKNNAGTILPSAGHVAVYHLLIEGSCRAQLDSGGNMMDLAQGDLILFPQGNGHRMGSDLRILPTPAEALVEKSSDGSLARIRHGGGGTRTRFVCGFLACDHRLCRPLLDALPAMLRVSMGDDPAAAWVADTLKRGANETHAPRAGTGAVLTRLAELLFVETLRRYVEMLPAEQRGWLAGLRDQHVSKALALLHAQPSCNWTVEDLGREVGLSRSALAERFVELIGEPPMQYLTRWRLALAARELRETRTPIIRLAAQVGYESESAFNRAFKREFGMPPAAWRRMSS
ncbi:MAG TPA: AraC family transcriptional regulator [Steroidobacteraceae bacterium]|jgi:AraC-like DNA-binding protein|nr:AraC family transcriptional regulator [Steroidobacteraceae bacterium]